MTRPAYDADNISQSIVAFAQFVRNYGLNVGIQETQDALLAANQNLIVHKHLLRIALKSLFCTSPEEGHLYESLFDLFWQNDSLDTNQGDNPNAIKGTFKQKNTQSLMMMSIGRTPDSFEEINAVGGANEVERLRKTDFSHLSKLEAEILEEIAQRLFREMTLRLRRRMKEHPTRGKINLRRTIRRSLNYGGDPIELFKKAQKPKKQRLIVLLDVSNSMDKYSFFLLRFIFALRQNFRQLEAFVFSTSLIRISKVIQKSKIETVLEMLSQQADNWSSGTKIGDCLETFYDEYGKQLLNGSPTVIILSDGLETGSAEKLGNQLRKIRLKSKKLVWLNPLKGSKNYQPLAKGMAAALPSIDDFKSAHNLESLLTLENILVNT